MTQCKALLELGGRGGRGGACAGQASWPSSFGVSVPSISRAVDGLVKAGLATRVEDPEDRRVRRIAITDQGEGAGRRPSSPALDRASRRSPRRLTAAQRRKLDAAVDSLLEREDIAATYEHAEGLERA